jgi:soluble lytic murein transglycosylase-like protein
MSRRYRLAVAMNLRRRLLLVGCAALVLASCGRRESLVDSPPPTRAEIWAAIQPAAKRYDIDPAFIYALVAAESNFDPRARNGNARGLLQLKPVAWRLVSREPYEPTVWSWRANLEAGIDYLAYSRSYVHKKTSFSYPKLLSAFHYGLDYLEERRFDVDRVPIPDNQIYRELWRGNLTPVPPPH